VTIFFFDIHFKLQTLGWIILKNLKDICKKSKNINVKNKIIKGNKYDKILKRQHRETALQNEVKLVTEMMQ